MSGIGEMDSINKKITKSVTQEAHNRLGAIKFCKNTSKIKNLKIKILTAIRIRL